MLVQFASADTCLNSQKRGLYFLSTNLGSAESTPPNRDKLDLTPFFSLFSLFVAILEAMIELFTTKKITGQKIRKALLTILCLSFSPTWAGDAKVSVGQAIHHDTSQPLRQIVQKIVPIKQKKEAALLLKRPDLKVSPETSAPDGGLQSSTIVKGAQGATPTPLLSVKGLSGDDTFDLAGVRLVPPSSNGDIGLNDEGDRIYFQAVNLVWGIFNATTGVLASGPFLGNSFWQGFGGFCQDNNDGNPIVLYDHHAGRWVFSQFSVNQGIQCVAVSATSDPLGVYNRYAFTVTPGGANDAPKLGVWADHSSGSSGQSAYTFTTRDFGGAGGTFSMGAGMMERDAMLNGAAAQFIKFSNPCTAGNCIEGQLPPHQAGLPPPNGTCPTFWAAIDASFDDSPSANDGYRNHKMCVDWSNLSNSTYIEGPMVVAGSNFDRFLAGNMISPVKDGEDLQALQHLTMYRAQYRWFGSYASVVLNTTVDAGDDRAGIRWAETRSTDGDSNWTLKQDGTYAPADGDERWMGSIAQDESGNIALGYSVAGPDLYPSGRYTSRLKSDAGGTLPGGEVSCHEGTAAQQDAVNRWGDYSPMSVDPLDGCTFWYTQEYFESEGSWGNWDTRICSFRLPECVPAIFRDGFEVLPPVCEPEDVEACYEGPSDTLGIGLCTSGTRTCEPDGQWGACNDWVGPKAEVCGDGQDNDCDGTADVGCTGDACDPLDSAGTCLGGLGCYIDSCSNNICTAACDGAGRGQAGSTCLANSGCGSGLQCWDNVCLLSCDPKNPSACSRGSSCVLTGVTVDGQKIGACSVL